MKFVEIKLNSKELSNKINKPRICGIGIDDSDYKTMLSINGLKIQCQYYRVWKQMIHRCYGKNSSAGTYKNCYVSTSWLKFMNFREWMRVQQWEGKVLDKDLKVPGNKMYSPKTCMFVSNRINCLFTNLERKYPRGVFLQQNHDIYFVSCTDENGDVKHIGHYKSMQKASNEYIKYKTKIINKICAKLTDIELINMLKNYVLYIEKENNRKIININLY